MTAKKNMHKTFPAIAFVVIGILLFLSIQKILVHKWSEYRQDSETPGFKFSELDELRGKGEIQAFFLGASGIGYSIDPMQIYRDHKIATFNLYSAGQRINGSYFLAKKVIDEFHPKVIFLDISSLFWDFYNDSFYHIILDNTPFSIDKFKFALEFARLDTGDYDLNRLKEALIPFYAYHSRWAVLKDYDFVRKSNYNLFQKGYYLNNRIVPYIFDPEFMNSIANIMMHHIGYTRVFSETGNKIEATTSSLYDSQIYEKNISYLEKIISLCENKGVRLILIKIPSISVIEKYSSAWTENKSDMVKKLAVNYNIPFLDLLYDHDLDLNLETDSMDGGIHLNHNGAVKVSDFVGNYLKNLPGIEMKRHEEYEKDLSIHEKVLEAANLQSVYYFTDYLKTIRNLSGKTVIFSVSDDMRRELDKTDISLLQSLGFKADFADMKYNNSYIAVIRDGVVEYESVSNRRIEYSTEIGNKIPCNITSSGWYTGSESTIVIDGTDVSVGGRGINIAVFDNESELVLDSVSFDTYDGYDPAGIRNNDKSLEYFNRYKNYLMQQDYNKK